MGYTGTQKKDLDITEPKIGTARVNELDDAIRQIKTAMLYGDDGITFGSGGDMPITSNTYIYTKVGTGTLNLPQISTVAAAGVLRKFRIINYTASAGSAHALTVAPYAGDTISPSALTELWRYESIEVIASTTDNVWHITPRTQWHRVTEEDDKTLDSAKSYANSASGNAYTQAQSYTQTYFSNYLSSPTSVVASGNSDTLGASGATAQVLFGAGLLTEIYATASNEHMFEMRIQKYIEDEWAEVYMRIDNTLAGSESTTYGPIFTSADHNDGFKIYIPYGLLSNGSNLRMLLKHMDSDGVSTQIAYTIKYKKIV